MLSPSTSTTGHKSTRPGRSIHALHRPAGLTLLFLAANGFAQSSGPRSAASAANNTGVGASAWSNTAQSLTSDNSYATVASRGISNYLTTSNFGFSLPNPSGVAGIQLEVERSTNGPSAVALNDAWSVGLTKSISAGSNRCLIVAYAQENGTDSRDLTALTYGSRPMTQLAEYTAGVSGGFVARIEVWALMEADIAGASSTTLSPTFASYTALEYCDVFTAAVFRNVDQVNPMSSVQMSGAQATTNPHQLGSAFANTAGSMAINLVTCGNRDSSNPGSNSNTSSYGIPTGYTEGIDYYFANTAVAPTTGACFQVAHKAMASAGNEQPSCNFNGSVNRYAIVGFSLQRAREIDHSVRLMKGGVIGGTDLASSAAWPTSDAYATYGGSTTLWGLTWTHADINASNFGAAVAANVQNGTARIDHMRITVWHYSTLPVELVRFDAEAEGRTVRLGWHTASESGNDHFIVQRSPDGMRFEDVARIPGAGDSQESHTYAARDPQPYPGISYYRLAQVDHDGSVDHSDIVAVNIQIDQPTVSPNPSTTGTFTVYGVDLENEQVAVFTSDMRLIGVQVDRGLNPVLHLEDAPDGAYILVARDGSRTRTTRLVKESRER